jgi:hypothetical protein
VVQGKLTRQFKYCMIDKSKTEIAALQAIGITYLLCLFHKLQDWERFLKSSDASVNDEIDRHTLLSWLRPKTASGSTTRRPPSSNGESYSARMWPLQTCMRLVCPCV